MNIKVMKNSKYFAIASSVIILIGIVMFITSGFNLGIDFTGGTVITLDMKGEFDSDVVREATKEFSTTDSNVATSEGTKAEIKMQDKNANPEEQNKIRENILAKIKETYPDATIESTGRVGATAGAELLQKTIMSVVIACAFILAYIWYRFEVLSGFSALIALIHDVLIMSAMVLIFKTKINSSFIAAILTFIGYSINDTIVVFDRIRENTKRYKSSLSRQEIADKSVSETIIRSLNTSITTLFTITALYIIGVQSIKEFALPLIVGIISGTYSSIFIASPFWVVIHKKRDNKANNKSKTKSKKA
jgi:preprotein translocase subunit SecF